MARSMRSFISLSIVFTLFLTGACSSTSTSPTTPATATPATTTETFAGTVAQLATTGNPFSVSANGPVTIELTSVEPLATMGLGVGIATWDGTTCGTAIAKNDNARSGATALNGTATAGSYCVTVYDSGNIPEGWTVSFSVQVIHP